MNNIWFTSDPHFGHTNIVLGTSKWDKTERCRKFETIEDHNQALIQGINKHVKYDDVLYCLGDWSFGGIENVLKFRSQINCSNIHLVLGNHDHHIANNKSINGLELRSLFTSVSKRIDKVIGGESFVLHHYALRTWDRAHHGTIHLYGHSHDTLPDYTDGKGNKYKCTDVGVDVAIRELGEPRPYHVEEIFQMMKNRVDLRVDHHNAKTHR